MKIERVILEGFKSFRERTEVPLGNLTLLAGANSSGKSTIMQTLLLMKQTLESGFDPGPLLISGQNVVFSNTEQMFWSAPGERREQITLGLKISEEREKVGYEVQLERQKGAATPLQIVRAVTYKDEQSVTLSPALTTEQQASYVKQFQQSSRKRLLSQWGENLDPHFEVQRDRFFLYVSAKLVHAQSGEIAVNLGGGFLDDNRTRFLVERAVRGIIHVPGLRGNPRRTYPVTAVERNFPGIFPDYVASVIAYWQEAAPQKASQLSDDLKELGLTWNVKARKLSDTEVEIQVARLPKGVKHGARDMVSIADVGFGLSQSLPVAVALLSAEPGELVYLEQPEIHLHPRAEYQLSRLIQRAVMRGVQVVVETHSELLLLGLQELVARQQFAEQSVMLHWVQRDKGGASSLTSKELDEKGGWGDVPIDFAYVSLEAMNNYLNVTGG